MTVPNRRDDPPEPSDQDDPESARRRNPASAYDERVTGVIEAASARASTVSHRFGGARYALRRDPAVEGEQPAEPEKPDAGEEPEPPKTES